ncbi:MAG: CarD family transcriptional regulator [Oscillospiraceae bacterium]|jgi:CarD family transcriptional regulator|nr:CarD family transcriptional regulator [Oscillospiraceae bacterium]MCI8877841.1 CarD family transcriptional regulator [Oscillospiraceae bacterium]
MFQIGDKVVHPMHGAGIIDDIVSERVGPTSQDYYVFKMPVGGLVLKIPTAKSKMVGLRDVVDTGEISQLLEAIPALASEMNSNWNHRYRENMERIKSGNLYEVARVIKGLKGREKEKGLSTGERKMLHTAKQILLSELVLVTGMDYSYFEEQINMAMVGG